MKQNIHKAQKQGNLYNNNNNNNNDRLKFHSKQNIRICRQTTAFFIPKLDKMAHSVFLICVGSSNNNNNNNNNYYYYYYCCYNLYNIIIA
jgi:hypothetical protein